MRFHYTFAISICILITVLSMNTHPCSKWAEPKKLGTLDNSLLMEASGMDVSNKYQDRIYHINDSGKKLELITTDMKGNKHRKIEINGYKNGNSDNEDLSTGPCYKNNCIFIGDIGDNLEKRTEIKIVILKERKSYPASVSPLKVLRLKYPDGPHNAESLAVHPNGDIYIISKESDFKKMKYYPSNIYRLKRSVWENNKGTSMIPELVGKIDTSLLNGGDRFFLNNIITSLDISGDGKKFILLTYQNAYEIYTDLTYAKSDTFYNIDNLSYSYIELKKLPQQEAISYVNSDKSFIYNTEYIKNHDVDLYKVDCIEK